MSKALHRIKRIRRGINHDSTIVVTELFINIAVVVNKVENIFPARNEYTA